MKHPIEGATKVMKLHHTVRAIGVLVIAFTGCRGNPYEGKSVAQLQQMLRDSNSNVQAQGAFGLSKLGPGARDAVPELIQCLQKEPIVRQYAALALGTIGSEAKDAVPALIESLGDTEWTVRRQAASALGQIGAEARAALADLQKLLRDKDSLVRKAASEAINKIR